MINKKLIILIPYFGPWPFWIDLFLRSCEKNNKVTWHLFGDHGFNNLLPENVIFHKQTFKEYCFNVSKTLVISFNPSNPYKLCDLKPALGAVHKELLKNYEYWAFSDLDLIYGDLLSYFKNDLGRFDLISTHATRVSGHLCLLKNNDYVITAFKEVDNWKSLLENPEHIFFDEKKFSKRVLPHKSWPKWFRRLVYYNDPIRWRSRFNEDYTTPRSISRYQWINGNDNLPEQWYWKDGVIQNNQTGNRSYPYFHFFEWKLEDWKTITPVLSELCPANKASKMILTVDKFECD